MMYNISNTLQEEITITVGEGTKMSDMLKMVEAGILEKVIIMTRYNQVRAAQLLGISRGTLRNKLKENFGNKYVGSRS